MAMFVSNLGFTSMLANTLPSPPPPRVHNQSQRQLPPRFRFRRIISTTLFGAVLECDSDATTGASVIPDVTHVVHSSAPPLRRGTPLAVKVVSLSAAEQATKIPRLAAKPDVPWQEHRVVTALMDTGGHMNVPRFYQQFVLDDSMFIVSDFCSNGDLFEYINSLPTGTVPENEARALFRQITLGVQYLHDHLNLAHRDLSLENVLLHDGVCKLSDFGLSCSASDLRSERVGKEYYMAPEVVACESYDPKRADVWSLGILLFILLTGSPLLPIASPEEQGFKALSIHGVVLVLRGWGVLTPLLTSKVHLLDSMLQVDPFKRINIADIAAHPALQL